MLKEHYKFSSWHRCKSLSLLFVMHLSMNWILNSHLAVLRRSSMIWWPWRSSTRCFSVPDRRTFSSSHSTTWTQSETLWKTRLAFFTRLMRRTNSSSRYDSGKLSPRQICPQIVDLSRPLKHARGEMADMWNGDNKNTFFILLIHLTLRNRELV